VANSPLLVGTEPARPVTGPSITEASAGLVALADRIELWPIDRLRPYERNPQRGDAKKRLTAA
jgi:hypothetical protein